MNILLLKFKRVSISCAKLSITDGPKQVVTAALQNAGQQVWVSWVLRYDYFKRIPRITVGVTRWRTSLLNGNNFTDNGDVSIWVNSSRVQDLKPHTKKLYFALFQLDAFQFNAIQFNSISYTVHSTWIK